MCQMILGVMTMCTVFQDSMAHLISFPMELMASLAVKVKMQKLAVGSKPVASAPRVSAGFTLIEMLVVLTILALMMAVVVPAINRGMTVTASDIARDVQIGLRKARSDAVTQQKSQAFVVDMQKRQFQIRGRKTTQLP